MDYGISSSGIEIGQIILFYAMYLYFGAIVFLLPLMLFRRYVW